jgi:putative sporulation protein YyaC
MRRDFIDRLKDSVLKVSYDQPNAAQLVSNQLNDWLSSVAPERKIVIVCIGTDRSTGDALGPIVGSRLERCITGRFEVYGTLEQPVHAVNLQQTLAKIQLMYQDPFIIGVDACLGQSSSIGQIQVGIGPVKPGAGVNKQLPPVGDVHITGVVNVGGFMEYFVLQNTRLHLVMKLAEVIAESLTNTMSALGRSFIPFPSLDESL